jgi:CheY-like chemotaxis protein
MEGRVSSIHFLLVDDEEVLIETIAERLRLKGLYCALSGNEALNQMDRSDTVDCFEYNYEIHTAEYMILLHEVK